MIGLNAWTPRAPCSKIGQRHFCSQNELHTFDKLVYSRGHERVDVLRSVGPWNDADEEDVLFALASGRVKREESEDEDPAVVVHALVKLHPVACACEREIGRLVEVAVRLLLAFDDDLLLLQVAI